MLEIEAWLEPLLAVDLCGYEIRQAVLELLALDLPELLAMMHGEKDVPDVLRPCLGVMR